MRTLALTTSALCGAALLLLVLLISLVHRPTLLVASVRERAERFIARQTLRASQAQQNTIVATLTVGTNPNECATGDQITVPAEAPIYFCMRVTNLTTATLTRHQLASNQMKDGGLPLNQTIERYYLEPGATMVITNGFLSQIGVDPLMTQRPSITSPQMSLVVTSSDLTGTLSFSATDSANVSIGRTGSELKEYINLLPSTCLQQDTVTLSEGQLIFYCVKLTNTGDVTLTHHILTFTEGLNTTVGEFDYPLSPGTTLTRNTLTLTANTLNDPNLTFQRAFSLGPFSVVSSKTLTLTSLSTNAEGYIAKAITSASIKVPQSPISLNLILWNELNTDGCTATQGGLTLNYGDRVLYCIWLRNNSSVPLTEHSFVEYLTPSTRQGLTYAYSATFSFNHTISAGRTLIITSQSSVLPEAVRALNVLGPFVVSKPITPSNQYINTILYEARNPTFSLQLKRSVSQVLPANAPPTETPTTTSSPTIGSTPTPLPGATATLALTTATPTATWTPVSVSVVIPPTKTPQPHVLGVTTPFPGQFNSPLVTATLLPVAQSFLATPSFTPDFAVLAAAQTADFIATTTMIALQFTPAPTFTPVGTDTPSATATETPTPTSTPTATPTPTITQRPVEQATPVATSNRSVPVGQMVNSAIIAAGWVWFLLGSLVFFVVAGVVAGLSFRQGERRRYRLDDDLTVRPPEARPSDPPAPPPRPKEGDDNWPASLP